MTRLWRTDLGRARLLLYALIAVLGMATAWLGPVFAARFEHWAGRGTLSVAAAAIAMLLIWRLAVSIVTPRGRTKMIAALSRLWRWEFWPAWLFYPPVAANYLRLAIRHRDRFEGNGPAPGG